MSIHDENLEKIRLFETWRNMLVDALSLSTADLRRHAHVSIDNRHECTNCFTCACAEILRRKERAR